MSLYLPCMLRRLSVRWVLFFSLIVFFGGLLILDGRTRLLLSQPTGFIAVSEISFLKNAPLNPMDSMLGVSIGQNRGLAVLRMQEVGFKYKILPTTGVLLSPCLPENASFDVQFDFLMDHSWRQAVVCIYSRRDKVVGVYWKIDPFSP